jgi:hypothetical protein
MRNGDIRMGYCLDSNNINKSDNGRPSQSVTNHLFNGSRLMWIIAIGVALLMSSYPAFGQFTVQPMKLELAVTPGKLIKSALDVQSFDPNEVYTMKMSVVELNQSEDGAWAIIEPNDLTDPNSPFFGFDISKLSSCSDWISLIPNNFELPPMGVVPVQVDIKVRRGIQGFFGAGILATTSPMRGAGDVSVVVRFLVPVILEIQDRPIRPKVQATDVGMEFIPAIGNNPSRAMVSMNIENAGGTFSRVKPGVRIWSFADGHWRVITTTEFQETGIIPGARLKLQSDVGKNLPKGKYKAAGILYVDGRRTKRIEKEMEFVGDPAVTRVALDAPLDLDPIDIIVDGMPGATRTSSLRVYNASDETVNIQTAIGLPSVLQNGALGDVKGEDLDCTGWLKITPEQFTLRGEGGQQTLQIVTKMPNTSMPYPTYFSLLALWASYPDGQKAGVTTTNICVRNNSVAAQPEAVALKLSIQDLGESKYLVVAGFGNYGMVQFVPIRVKAGVTMSTGINRAGIFLSGNPNLMLPFESRNFSGVMDLSYIPADLYRLAAAIEYAPGVWADKQMAIRVSIEGGRRMVQIEGVEEELSELVEIKW